MARRRSCLGWLGIGCGGFIGLVVLLMVGFYLQTVCTTPKTVVPPPTKPPTPNAYDYYLQAGQSIKNANDIGYLLDGKKYSQATGQVSQCTLADKESAVSANTAALALVKQGLNYECLSPDQSSWMPITTFPQEAGALRNLGRLCLLKTQVKAAHGDWYGAVKVCLDTTEVGGDLLRGANMNQSLIASIVQLTGRREIWPILNHLSPDQTRQVLKRMKKIQDRHVSASEMLAEEKRDGIAHLYDLMTSGPPTPTGTTNPKRYALPNFVIRKAQYEYGKRFDELIAESKKPYPLRRAPGPGPKSLNPITAAARALANILLPVAQRSEFTFEKNDSLNGLLTVSLALRCYKFDHGSYPSSLNQLTGKYLSKLPDDPFAAKGTFGYKRTGSVFLLYSLGPDGKDDAGKPICDPKRPVEDRYYVELESKGDIVAGVSR